MQLSLTARILVVNILSLALFAGGLFFLDAFRARLVAERAMAAERHAAIVARTLPVIPAGAQARYIRHYAAQISGRVRVYAADGALAFDSFAAGRPAYRLHALSEEPLAMRAALIVDRAVDFAVGARPAPPFTEPVRDVAAAWPVIARATVRGRATVSVATAPDQSPMLVAAAPLARNVNAGAVLVTQNARDAREAVRAQRSGLALYFLMVLIIAVLLSLFLARTIVRPLGRLARSAVRVRLGRAREVTVPRLPERRDEIGMLARALSDMSNGLRQRIDATEAFAADVAHEIKNPLASLRSALDALEGIEDETLRRRLIGVAQDDVHRLDRLISDISDASRLDAQLARAHLEPVDLGDMIAQLLAARAERGEDGSVQVILDASPPGSAVVLGEDVRLERVIDNLVDNAVSFSPPAGLVRVAVAADAEHVTVIVEDEGPGIPQGERESVFRRFHSTRPDSEPFGRHSGLGLAIARTIAEGHQGRIDTVDRPDGRRGARFELKLPHMRMTGERG